jgi:lauroyl/myristoyl acyltransferase
MGTLIPAGRDAPLKLAEALQKGQHVAMLVDQYLTNGVEVTFFGRKTKANPMMARLLRQVECPIHGVRIIRLPGHRFRAELVRRGEAGARRLRADRHSRARCRRSRRWSKAGSANIPTNGCGCTAAGGSPPSS